MKIIIILALSLMLVGCSSLKIVPSFKWCNYYTAFKNTQNIIPVKSPIVCVERIGLGFRWEF